MGQNRKYKDNTRTKQELQWPYHLAKVLMPIGTRDTQGRIQELSEGGAR